MTDAGRRHLQGFRRAGKTAFAHDGGEDRHVISRFQSKLINEIDS